MTPGTSVDPQQLFVWDENEQYMKSLGGNLVWLSALRQTPKWETQVPTHVPEGRLLIPYSLI